MSNQKITPCLWFETQALEAAEFYTSIFPNSAIHHVQRAPTDTPGQKAGGVLLVVFSLAGQGYQALNGGKHETFNDAVSLSVICEDQAEVDRLWEHFAQGGKTSVCGWLKDRWGFAWQIAPRRFFELMDDPDAERKNRVFAAMLKMTKLDIAGLEAAARG